MKIKIVLEIDTDADSKKDALEGMRRYFNLKNAFENQINGVTYSDFRMTDYDTTVGKLVEAARGLLKLIDDVGNDTDWKDSAQTDRVFALYEFDEIRAALKALVPEEK